MGGGEATLVSVHAATPAPSKGWQRPFRARCAAPSGADAAFPSNRQHTLAGPQMALDSFFHCRGYLGPPEPLALLHGPLKPGADSLADHAALELGKGAGDLKHQPSGRRRRVDRLLVEVQINAASLKRLDRAEKVDAASGQAGQSPKPSPRQTVAFGRLSASRSSPGRASRPLAPLMPASWYSSTTSQPRRSAIWRSSRSWFSTVCLSECQAPAITELSLLDAEGKFYKVSRLTIDVVGSGTDYSKEAKFTETVARKIYYGPVYLLRRIGALHNFGAGRYAARSWRERRRTQSQRNSGNCATDQGRQSRRRLCSRRPRARHRASRFRRAQVPAGFVNSRPGAGGAHHGSFDGAGLRHV